jgi:hypothetical protein
MSSDCLEEWLVCGKATEVEGLTPCFLVESGCKVVVAILRVSITVPLCSWSAGAGKQLTSSSNWRSLLSGPRIVN